MTDREKCIEGMARVICQSSSNRGRCDKCGFNKDCTKFEEATALYENGYGVTFAKDTDVPSKWISVDDEKPKRNGCYLCYYLASSINGNERWETRVLYWEDRLWLHHPRAFTVARKVTHWMPLPEPPREE